MSDCMTFPDTVEEYMEQCKIVDTDGIYMSKGAELVPIFRMEQWFEHLPSAQPELYGYKIEHLALIARVMQKEGVSPEDAVRAFNDIQRICGMVVDEVTEIIQRNTKKH